MRGAASTPAKYLLKHKDWGHVLSFGQLVLDGGYFTAQTGICFKPPAKARDGFADKRIVQTASGLARSGEYWDAALSSFFDRGNRQSEPRPAHHQTGSGNPKERLVAKDLGENSRSHTQLQCSWLGTLKTRDCALIMRSQLNRYG